MASKRAGKLPVIRTLRSVFKTLFSSKMAIAGLLILVVYIALAVGAPLITPYSPLGGAPVAGFDSPPVWYSYFSEGARLTQNQNLAQSTPFTTNPTTQGWQLTALNKDGSANPNIKESFNTTSSYFGPGSGSVQITLNPSTGPSGTYYTVNFEKSFQWSYVGPPARFLATLALKANYSQGNPVTASIYILRDKPRTQFIITNNGTWTGCSAASCPVQFDSSRWWQPNNFGGIDSSTPLMADLLNANGVTPAAKVFSSPGKYTFGISLTFYVGNAASTGPTTVLLDNVNFNLLGTSWGLMGTDSTGHDVFSQLVYGARISLVVGLLSAAIGIGVGLAVGLMAGYLGRVVDEVLMRFTDMLLVIPTLPLLIILIAVLQGHGTLPALILVIGFLGWMGFARVVRAQVLSLKERPFIEAAKAAGAGTGHITVRHIMPNIVGLIYVNLALSVPAAILSEAALSFLGLGDTTVLSWGRMLNLVEEFRAGSDWWWVIPPGISIALVSLSFVMIGFSLDSIFNPRLRQRR